MDFDHAVQNIVSRVKELGTGASFTYEEINQWLKTSSGDDLMRTYDSLSDRLTIEHSMCLELTKNRIVAVVPEDIDIKEAHRRSGIDSD